MNALFTDDEIKMLEFIRTLSVARNDAEATQLVITFFQKFIQDLYKTGKKIALKSPEGGYVTYSWGIVVEKWLPVLRKPPTPEENTGCNKVSLTDRSLKLLREILQNSVEFRQQDDSIVDKGLVSYILTVVYNCFFHTHNGWKLGASSPTTPDIFIDIDTSQFHSPQYFHPLNLIMFPAPSEPHSAKPTKS